MPRTRRATLHFEEDGLSSIVPRLHELLIGFLTIVTAPLTWWFFYSLQSRVDRFWSRLSRDFLLEKQIRDIDSRYDKPILELRDVHAKAGRLRQVFKKYAIKHAASGEDVWDFEQFAAFLDDRLQTVEQPLRIILWRMFFFNASFPFMDGAAAPQAQYVDFKGWRHVIARLAARRQHRPVHKERKETYSQYWSRFQGMAVRSAEHEISLDLDGWVQPNNLDQIKHAVFCQMPDVRPLRVKWDAICDQRVLDKFGDPPTHPAEQYTIPYEQLLALIAASMRVSIDWAETQFPEGPLWPQLRHHASTDYEKALASSILNTIGVKPGSKVYITQFVTLMQRYSFIGPSWITWTLYDEIDNFWSALFNLNEITIELSRSRPPLDVLHALDVLLPADDDRHWFRQQYWRARQAHSISPAFASVTEIIEALTKVYSQKVLILRGHCLLTSELSTFVMLTSSPLWFNHKNGTDEFITGEKHMILQLSPTARALICQADLNFKDVIHTANSTLEFGTLLSALSIDLQACTATLTSQGDTGYRDLALGAAAEADNDTDTAEWTSSMSIEQIEVYNIDGGVLVGLEISDGEVDPPRDGKAETAGQYDDTEAY